MHRLIRVVAIVGSIGLGAQVSAQATQPAAKPAPAPRPAVLEKDSDHSPEGARRRHAESRKQQVMATPVAGRFELDEVLDVRLVKGIPQAHFTFARELADVEASQKPARLDVPGGEGMWWLNVKRDATSAPGSYTELQWLDPDAILDPDRVWSVSLHHRNDRTTFTGFLGGQQDMRLLLTCGQTPEQGVQLTIPKGHRQDAVRLRGPTLHAILKQDPRRVRTSVGPVLARFGAGDLLEPGAAEVYRVFADIQPDEAARQALEDLLPKLSSEESAEREAATQELLALGKPGVLAAMRLDPATLEPEQGVRLAAFIARHTHWPDEAVGPEQPDFLMGALAFEDVRIRAAAKAALERVTGSTVDFDPTAPEATRAAQLAVLRRDATTTDAPPTTAPAPTVR